MSPCPSTRRSCIAAPGFCFQSVPVEKCPSIFSFRQMFPMVNLCGSSTSIPGHSHSGQLAGLFGRGHPAGDENPQLHRDPQLSFFQCICYEEKGRRSVGAFGWSWPRFICSHTKHALCISGKQEPKQRRETDGGVIIYFRCWLPVAPMA
ncbi:hypothetical protein BS78_10G039000 [Paspalum vaginatum]|nr:hypothetical protein BS78_10G039000 [Paspalum vaginatum]